MKMLGRLFLALNLCVPGLSEAAETLNPPLEPQFILDAPLSSGLSEFSAANLQHQIKLINDGTSELPPADQRIVLETALNALVRAIAPGGGQLINPRYYPSASRELNDQENERLYALEQLLYNAVEDQQIRTAKDRILGVVVMAHFGLLYSGIKLVALHDRLNLGWRVPETSLALPTLLNWTAERAAIRFLKDDVVYPLNFQVRLLSALRTAPELAAGPEVEAAFAEFKGMVEQNLTDRLAPVIAQRVRRPLDVISVLFTNTWLAAAAIMATIFSYQSIKHGLPSHVAADPVLFLGKALLMTVPPVMLNLVARGRMNDRRKKFEQGLANYASSCADAL